MNKYACVILQNINGTKYRDNPENKAFHSLQKQFSPQPPEAHTPAVPDQSIPLHQEPAACLFADAYYQSYAFGDEAGYGFLLHPSGGRNLCGA